MTHTRPDPLARTTDRAWDDVPTLPLVRGTGAAMNAVRDVERRHGPVVLALADDGDLRCVRTADFGAGGHDVLLGTVCSTPVYADRRQLVDPRLAVLVIDVEHGGAPAPSLGAGVDQHFVGVLHDACSPHARPA